MIISSLPIFLYLKLTGVKVVTARSFFTGICRGSSFFSSTYVPRRFSKKGMKNDFLPVLLGAYGAIKMVFLYTILIFFIIN